MKTLIFVATWMIVSGVALVTAAVFMIDDVYMFSDWTDKFTRSFIAFELVVCAVSFIVYKMTSGKYED